MSQIPPNSLNRWSRTIPMSVGISLSDGEIPHLAPDLVEHKTEVQQFSKVIRIDFFFHISKICFGHRQKSKI